MLRLMVLPVVAAGAIAWCAAAEAACVRSGEPVSGELREVRTTDSTGQLVASFQVALKTPLCIEIDPGEGAVSQEPEQIEDVRSIELVLAVPSESLEFGELLGAEVEVRGRFEHPVETVHTGDAVLVGAEINPIEGAVTPRAIPAVTPAAIDDQIERFVRDFYLSGEDVDAEQIQLLYAPAVHYFGRDDVAATEIVRDKLSYYKRWPDRTFKLIEGTLDIRRLERSGIPGAVYDVAFEYDFDVRRAGDVKRGRGLTVLTIDLNDGDGHILRETGRVLRRL